MELMKHFRSEYLINTWLAQVGVSQIVRGCPLSCKRTWILSVIFMQFLSENFLHFSSISTTRVIILRPLDFLKKVFIDSHAFNQLEILLTSYDL